jgi:hypothetical protein
MFVSFHDMSKTVKIRFAWHIMDNDFMIKTLVKMNKISWNMRIGWFYRPNVNINMLLYIVYSKPSFRNRRL